MTDTTELEWFEAWCRKCGHYNAVEMVEHFRLYQASLLQKQQFEKDES